MRYVILQNYATPRYMLKTLLRSPRSPNLSTQNVSLNFITLNSFQKKIMVLLIHKIQRNLSPGDKLWEGLPHFSYSHTHTSTHFHTFTHWGDSHFFRDLLFYWASLNFTQWVRISCSGYTKVVFCGGRGAVGLHSCFSNCLFCGIPKAPRGCQAKPKTHIHAYGTGERDMHWKWRRGIGRDSCSGLTWPLPPLSSECQLQVTLSDSLSFHSSTLSSSFFIHLSER